MPTLRKSEDGHDYNVEPSPCTVVLRAVQYAEEPLEAGYKAHHLYVRARELKEKFLPLNANPREPRVTPQVKAMQKTLADSPEEFVRKNNGLTTICSGVAYDAAAAECTVTFGDGEGVCNGGHTYFAIVTAPAGVGDDALVHLELLQLPQGLPPGAKRQEITKIARARNANVHLTLRSESDFLGYYDPLKAMMTHPEWVSWHEGDSDAVENRIRADDLIRMLSALDPLQFYHPEYEPTKKRHKAAVMSGKALNHDWFEKTEDWINQGQVGLRPLLHLAPLIDDIFRLRDLMAETFAQTMEGSSFRQYRLYQEQIKNKERESLTNPGAIGHAPPPTIEILLLGLFRTNVWIHEDASGEVDLVGWVIEPARLWDLRRNEVLEALAGAYNDADAEPTIFTRADSPYRQDLYVLGTGQKFPETPEVVYLVSTGHQFVRLQAPDASATHYILPGSADGLVAVDGTAPAGAVLYRAG